MTWLKLDDGFGEHPKVMALSAGAFRAHVRAMCWAARQETDGRIARKVASDLTTKRQRIELVQVGVWDELPDGEFAIHDFLEYNPSHAKLKEKRASTRRRVNAHRNGVTGNVGNDVGSTSPGPARTRTPKEARPPNPPPEAAAAAAHEVPRAREDSGRAGVVLPDGSSGVDLRDFAGRLQVTERTLGEPPVPRKDPLGHRIPLSRWFPDRHWLDWQRELGMTNRAFEDTLAEARDKLGGLHDIEWWDIKLVRFFEVGARKQKPPGAPASMHHGALPHHLARLLPGGGR